MPEEALGRKVLETDKMIDNIKIYHINGYPKKNICVVELLEIVQQLITIKSKVVFPTKHIH